MKKIALLLVILLFGVCMISCTLHLHNEKSVIVKEATCTEEGIENIVCTICGKVLSTNTIPKSDYHSWITLDPVDPTCESVGLTEGYKCSLCGEIDVAQKEIPMIPHTYDDDYDESCNVCGHIRDAACPHNSIEIIYGYESTCTEYGYTDGERCLDCGEIVAAQELIDYKPHSEVIDKKIPATCIKEGLSEGKHCSVCSTVLVEQKVIEKTGHTPSSQWIVDVEATETEDGKRHIECYVCGETLDEEIIPYTGSKGLKFTQNNEGGYTVTAGSCRSDHVVIPYSYNGKPVTSIGKGAFKDLTVGSVAYSMKSVVIPDSVTSIGDEAFYHCYHLTKVVFGEGSCLKTIGNSAFAECIELSEITFPLSLVKIGDDAFYRCIVLKSLDLKNNAQLTEIGESAFLACTSLENVVLPDLLTKISDSCFYACESIVSITISSNVNYIGALALGSLDSLEKIVYTSTVSEWNEIKKHSGYSSAMGNTSWNAYTSFILYCTNGEIAPDGTVTYYQ